MNGKIKTKFAALFAVALMITVCVVPMVGAAEGDAAPVSSSDAEVLTDVEILLMTVGGENDGMVYYGPWSDKIPGEFTGTTNSATAASNDTVKAVTQYWRNAATGKLLRCSEMAGQAPTTNASYIQITGSYKDGDINAVALTVTIEHPSLAGGKKIISVGPFNNGTVGTESGVREFLKSVALGGFVGTNDDSDDELELAPELRAGDFKVAVKATQGVEVQEISKTLNAGSAVTVSGKVTDADGKAIEKAKIVINDNTSNFVKTDKDGKYSFNVVPGSDVKVSVVYDELKDSNNVALYTFDVDKDDYSFGDVYTSVTKDFQAKEKTGSIQVNSANGIAIGNASVSVQWYYQYRTAQTGSYTIVVDSLPTGITAGVAKVGATVNTDKNGEVWFTYTNASGSPTNTSSITYYDYVAKLVVKGSSVTGYTFDTSSIQTGEDNLATQISAKAGQAAVENGQATIKTKENTAIVYVQSANGNPIASSVSVQWYYQYRTAQTGNYTILDGDDSLPTGITAGKVNLTTSLTSTVGETGKVTFSYELPVGAPTNNANTTYYDYAAVLVVKGTGTSPYSFDAPDFDVTKTIASVISSKAGLAAVENGQATIKAKENAYKISGALQGYSALAIDEDGVLYGTDGTVTDTGAPNAAVQKDGSYAFYVKKDSDLSLKLNILGYVESNKTINLGTITADKVYNFTKAVDSAQTVPVKYWVTGLETGDKVQFEYSVDQASYTSIINAASGKAELIINAVPGSLISVDAEVISTSTYDLSEFDGYKAVATKVIELYYRLVSSSGTSTVPVAGETIDVSYTYAGEEITEVCTSDENGFFSIVKPMTGATDSVFSIGEMDFTATASGDSGYLFNYNNIDVTRAYPVVSNVTVSVDYVSAYNEENAVSYAKIAISDEKSALPGSSVALKAPAIQGFKFVAWMIDGVVVSESADYTLNVEAGCSVQALYAADVPAAAEDNSNAFNINVLIIGLVILVLGILAVAYGIISKKQ